VEPVVVEPVVVEPVVVEPVVVEPVVVEPVVVEPVVVEPMVAIYEQAMRGRNYSVAGFVAKGLLKDSDLLVDIATFCAVTDLLVSPHEELSRESIRLATKWVQNPRELDLVPGGLGYILFNQSVHAFLVTGNDVFRQLTRKLVGRNATEDGFTAMINGYSDIYQLQGKISSSSKKTVIQDQSSMLMDLKMRMHHEFERAGSRRIGYVPIRDVIKEWCRSDGHFGKLAEIVTSNNQSQVDVVRQICLRLNDPEEILEEAHRTSRRIGNEFFPDGGQKNSFIRVTESVVGIANDWLGLVASQTKEVFVKAPDALLLKAMEEALGENGVRLREEMISISRTWTQNDEFWISNFAELMASRIEAFLGGYKTTGKEVDVDTALIWGCALRPEIPLGQESRDESTFGFSTIEWEDALRSPTQDVISQMVSSRDFGRLEILAQVYDSEARRDLNDVLSVAVDAMETDCKDELQRSSNELASLIALGRLLGLVEDSEATQVLGVQNLIDQQMDAERPSFSSLMDLAKEVAVPLQVKIGDLKTGLKTQLKGLIDDQSISKTNFETLAHLIDKNELATAQSLIGDAQNGIPFPPSGETVIKLENFYPSFVAKIGRIANIDKKIREMISRNDFSEVTSIEPSDVQLSELTELVNDWRSLLALKPSERIDQNVPLAVTRLLRKIGIEPKGNPKFVPSNERGDIRILNAVVSSVEGRAMIPKLGSQLPENTFEIILLFEKKSPQEIVDLVMRRNSNLQPLVLYLGQPFDSDERRKFQTASIKCSKMVLLVDFSVFLFLIFGNREKRFELMVHLTVPFTFVNPYISTAGNRVPREMFFGRSKEVEDLQREIGPSFVTGGRQLGKSAMLRQVEAQFGLVEDHIAFYLDLNTAASIASVEQAQFWQSLAKGLLDKGVLTETSKVPTADFVCTGIEKWINAKGTRRLLVLLDECDSWLKADDKNGFLLTHELRRLMDTTQRKCKFVFAGLVSVRRWQVSNNSPIPHISSGAITVGALPPKDAIKLVQEPMRCLGIELSQDQDLKILSFTNNHASLIQVVCQRIVKTISTKPISVVSATRTISDDDLHQLLHSEDLLNETANRFRMTIELNPQYSVISYVVALKSLQNLQRGFEPESYSLDEIREMAIGAWKDGFDDEFCDREEFKYLLEELESFSILQRESNSTRQKMETWRLKSPSIVRMLGTTEDIKSKLKKHRTLERNDLLGVSTERFASGVAKIPSPLTSEQVNSLAERNVGSNGLVIGSLLSGLLDLDEMFISLRSIQGIDASKFAEIVFDLESDGQLVDITQRPKGTILIIGPAQLTNYKDAIDTLGIPQVTLKPWTSRAFAKACDLMGVSATSEAQSEFLRYSGGWHSFVSQIFRSATSVQESCADIKRSLSDSSFRKQVMLDAGIDTAERLNMCNFILDNGPIRKEDIFIQDFLEEIPTERRQGILRELEILGVVRIQSDAQIVLNSLIQLCLTS